MGGYWNQGDTKRIRELQKRSGITMDGPRTVRIVSLDGAPVVQVDQGNMSGLVGIQSALAMGLITQADIDAITPTDRKETT